MAAPRANDPSDAHLLGGIAAGDPMALRRLMDRFDRLVRYTVYRISRDRCRRDPLWLDSVASEVWTDLCRSARAGRTQAVADIQSYLIQIARRRCIDALRRRGETPVGGGADEAVYTQVPAAEEDTAHLLATLEELSALRRCLDGLKEPDRRLCGELAAITAGRWREAAGRLGMPESTLRSRWKRVLEKLRTCLESGGWTR